MEKYKYLYGIISFLIVNGKYMYSDIIITKMENI